MTKIEASDRRRRRTLSAPFEMSGTGVFEKEEACDGALLQPQGRDRAVGYQIEPTPMREANASRARRAVEAPCQPKPSLGPRGSQKESLKQLLRLDRIVPLEQEKSGVGTVELGSLRLLRGLIGSLYFAFVHGTSGSCKIRRVGVSLNGCVERIANQDGKTCTRIRMSAMIEVWHRICMTVRRSGMKHLPALW